MRCVRLTGCSRWLRSEIAVPVGGGHTAIHEEIAAGDEPTVRPHEQRSDIAHLIGRAGAPNRRYLNHAPVPCAAWPGEFALRRGVTMMPGLIALTRAPRFPQRTASAITRSEFPRFAIWYA